MSKPIELAIGYIWWKYITNGCTVCGSKNKMKLSVEDERISTFNIICDTCNTDKEFQSG